MAATAKITRSGFKTLPLPLREGWRKGKMRNSQPPSACPLPKRYGFAQTSHAAWIVCVMWIAASTATNVFAAPTDLRDIGFDQRLDAQVPLDVQFLDEAGKTVRLADYFGDKPVVLVLAYYECPRLCNLVLNGLVQGMLEMNLNAGDDFQVVVVSFDPREKPPLAASKKQAYVMRYRRKGAAEGMHFLTGDEDQIKQLTSAVGFRYKFDAEQNQFIHASGIMILTPTGKISRYFYDVDYPGRDLRLGLVEASSGKIGSPVDQILLYCFHYDATVGRYSASIMNIVRMLGVLTMATIGMFVLFLQRWHGRRIRAAVMSTQAGGDQTPQDGFNDVDDAETRYAQLSSTSENAR